ncbi:MFS transporter [Candidatus Woesearchaeota archaeon]|nr:MFS transporter [Candidatus Woesearchaeota archaeon]
MTLSRNVNRMFWYMVTQRRHFIPILSVFFLSLPDTRAQQIGLFMAIGSLTSFLTEIPSGYVADRVGHKRTLVLAKAFMLLSTVSFGFASSLWQFILGSILLNLSISFMSGTRDAFMHNTLISLGRGGEYTRVMSRLGANASLLSVLLALSLPLLSKVRLVLPIRAMLVLDVAGLFVALSFSSPPQLKARAERSVGRIAQGIRRAASPSFWPAILFVGFLGGFLLAASPYRPVFLESLGYPVAWLGAVMAFSRLVWFVVGRFAHVLEERVGVERLLAFEMVVFPLWLAVIALVGRPFVAAALFAILVGYRWGREQVVTRHFLDNFIRDGRLKATMLSVKGQVRTLVMASVTFGIGFVMERSFQSGFLVLAGAWLVALAVSFVWLRRSLASLPSRHP